MTEPSSTEPPRWQHVPRGGMPDNCIGGSVEGGGDASGNALLLDNTTGQAAGNVIENEVSLVRESENRHNYQFSGVPEGSYRVKVTLDTQATRTSGPVGPGTTVETLVF